MARKRSSDLDEIIRVAVEGVIARVSKKIAATLDEAVRTKAGADSGRRERHRRPRREPSRRGEDITSWKTDRRARRVPNFVIEMTGLDTKKKLIAQFGSDVTFHRGQPLPPAKAEKVAAPVVAKPPRIRKAGSA